MRSWQWGIGFVIIGLAAVVVAMLGGLFRVSKSPEAENVAWTLPKLSGIVVVAQESENKTLLVTWNPADDATQVLATWNLSDRRMTHLAVSENGEQLVMAFTTGEEAITRIEVMNAGSDVSELYGISDTPLSELRVASDAIWYRVDTTWYTISFATRDTHRITGKAGDLAILDHGREVSYIKHSSDNAIDDVLATRVRTLNGRFGSEHTVLERVSAVTPQSDSELLVIQHTEDASMPQLLLTTLRGERIRTIADIPLSQEETNHLAIDPSPSRSRIAIIGTTRSVFVDGDEATIEQLSGTPIAWMNEDRMLVLDSTQHHLILWDAAMRSRASLPVLVSSNVVSASFLP